MTFYKDDIIEIISESNADWWTGKANGRTGLFPSNYVEKLVHPVPPALANLNSSSPNPQSIVVHVHQPQSQSEASQPQYAAYNRTPQAPPMHHESDKGEKKEGKYSQLKSTMAHSAAGGLGFGAGTWDHSLRLLSFSPSDRWMGNRCCDRRGSRPRHLLDLRAPPARAPRRPICRPCSWPIHRVRCGVEIDSRSAQAIGVLLHIKSSVSVSFQEGLWLDWRSRLARIHPDLLLCFPLSVFFAPSRLDCYMHMADLFLRIVNVTAFDLTYVTLW